jgi:hypothetical protein
MKKFKLTSSQSILYFDDEMHLYIYIISYFMSIHTGPAIRGSVQVVVLCTKIKN